LIVTDNGHGLPENYNLSKNDSFDLSLIRGMSEDLDGNFIIENHHGTKITIVFENTLMDLNRE
jgi:two-component sensor histidine kinase